MNNPPDSAPLCPNCGQPGNHYLNGILTPVESIRFSCQSQKGGDDPCIANTDSCSRSAPSATTKSTLAIASNAEPKSNPSVSASPAPEPKCPTCGCAHIIEIEHADGTFTCVMGHEFSASPAPSPLLAPIVERAKNTVAYWKEMADIERGEREIMERERDAARREGNCASCLIDKIDLMRDEFQRIAVCPASDNEIKGLCERAISDIHQHVPVIVQRDKAEADRDRLTAEAQALREECASHKQAVIDAMSLSNDMAEIEARKLAALREETQRLRAAMKDAMDIAEWNLPYFVVEPRLAKTRFAAAREILSQAISLSEKPLAQVPQTDANPKNPEN